MRESTPVTGIERRDGRVVLTTPTATVRAWKVVLATNAWTHLLPGLESKQVPVWTYIVLTEPQGRFSEAGFLGPKYTPFATGGDPGQARFVVEGVVAQTMTDERQLDIVYRKLKNLPQCTQDTDFQRSTGRDTIGLAYDQYHNQFSNPPPDANSLKPLLEKEAAAWKALLGTGSMWLALSARSGFVRSAARHFLHVTASGFRVAMLSTSAR